MEKWLANLKKILQKHADRVLVLDEVASEVMTALFSTTDLQALGHKHVYKLGTPALLSKTHLLLVCYFEPAAPLFDLLPTQTLEVLALNNVPIDTFPSLPTFVPLLVPLVQKTFLAPALRPSTHRVASALSAAAFFSALFAQLGPPQEVLLVGAASVELGRVLDLQKSWHKTNSEQFFCTHKEVESETRLRSLLLFDRDADPYSPLLSQKTFAGLLDDLGIDSFVDTVFEEIAHLNCLELSVFLKEELEKSATAGETLRKQTDGATPEELTALVLQTKELKRRERSLEKHFQTLARISDDFLAAEQTGALSDFEVRCLAGTQRTKAFAHLKTLAGDSLANALCLFSLSFGGLTNKEWNECLQKLEPGSALERLRRFADKENFSPNWRKSVLVPFCLLGAENDSRFHFGNGYRPLVAALVERFLENNNLQNSALLDTLVSSGIAGSAHCFEADSQQTTNVDAVVVLGGVTMTEVACLQQLYKDKNRSLLLFAGNKVQK